MVQGQEPWEGARTSGKSPEGLQQAYFRLRLVAWGRRQRRARQLLLLRLVLLLHRTMLVQPSGWRQPPQLTSPAPLPAPAPPVSPGGGEALIAALALAGLSNDAGGAGGGATAAALPPASQGQPVLLRATSAELQAQPPPGSFPAYSEATSLGARGTSSAAAAAAAAVAPPDNRGVPAAGGSDGSGQEAAQQPRMVEVVDLFMLGAMAGIVREAAHAAPAPPSGTGVGAFLHQVVAAAAAAPAPQAAPRLLDGGFRVRVLRSVSISVRYCTWSGDAVVWRRHTCHGRAWPVLAGGGRAPSQHLPRACRPSAPQTGLHCPSTPLPLSPVSVPGGGAGGSRGASVRGAAQGGADAAGSGGDPRPERGAGALQGAGGCRLLPASLRGMLQLQRCCCSPRGARGTCGSVNFSLTALRPTCCHR